MPARYIGIDLGAETLKAVELILDGGGLRWARRHAADHGKDPGPALCSLLREWDWPGARAAAATGRLGRILDLPRAPGQQAEAAGYRFLHPGQPATLVTIGSRGFSVLELRASGGEVYRENGRCAQGTGNFLRQLVARFGLTVEQASALSADVTDPAPLSGRCPVILKTDMTHLANRGEGRERILAGLYDAVAENVAAIVKPRGAPDRVALLGGVTRSPRIRRSLARLLARHGMELLPWSEEEAVFCQALGAAVIASAPNGTSRALPELSRLVSPPADPQLTRLPALSSFLPAVTRVTPPPLAGARPGQPVIVGLDLGSTGSKAAAIDAASGELLWDAYTPTSGDPVGAAQQLVRSFLDGSAGRAEVVAAGVTGSGREIAGSLLTACFAARPVFVMNEIAAHAEGALSCDPRVDTIFEIGGQDAKYIRLEGGRVVDAAMNEACSAGTGSFIEEQGRRLSGFTDVAALGREAIAAGAALSLGQHCSVFMAEVLDAGVAAGEERGALVAGLYDAVIQNYIFRVKGPRPVGKVVFCQGMPFSSDALAAAVARQTGSEVIVPPRPGTAGALGIALLARRHVPAEARAPLDLARFLAAEVVGKEAFVCSSTRGCGGEGARCRVERLTTRVAGESQRFAWGGACSLHDRGTRRARLPDGAPDPFRQREEEVARIVAALPRGEGRPRVAMTDEFALKGLFPFFVTFLSALGFEPVVRPGGGQAALKRGLEEGRVPFCAPMQLHHGLVAELAEAGAASGDRLFVPRLRSLPRVRSEPHGTTCPIVQAGPDLLAWGLGEETARRIVAPVIDVGAEGGLRSPEFRESCRALAASLGALRRWEGAWEEGVATQQRFDDACLDLGRSALSFAREHGILPVVVLGRPYTIHNRTLNSNVPALLREQGAMAIPVDCLAIETAVPVLEEMYWAHGQRILCAAHVVRRTPGLYSVFCSNYSCGPDSMTLTLYAHAMEGKPFAVIETDGHSGDAGTKTRVEAFLHCAREDLSRSASTGTTPGPVNDLRDLRRRGSARTAIVAEGRRLVVPNLGPSAQVLEACLRGTGMDVELLPPSDASTLARGRRHTSGKECLPLVLTLGGLLERWSSRPDGECLGFLMPTSCGPCRLGCYHLVQKAVLDRLGTDGEIRFWSPDDENYFGEAPGATPAIFFAGLAACDALAEALLDVRPVESRAGAAEAIFREAHEEVVRRVEAEVRRGSPLAAAFLEAGSGRMFGIAAILERAARRFAAIKGSRPVPTVGMGGEIFVRLDPFSNGFTLQALESRGLRVRLSPGVEWFEYIQYLHRARPGWAGLSARPTWWVEQRFLERAHRLLGRALGWPPRLGIEETLAAGSVYLRPSLEGEAILTVGAAVALWRRREVDGYISVGPLECMPNKVAESQLAFVTEREGLPSLTLSLHGDPVDEGQLDGFVFAVEEQFRRRQVRDSRPPTP